MMKIVTQKMLVGQGLDVFSLESRSLLRLAQRIILPKANNPPKDVASYIPTAERCNNAMIASAARSAGWRLSGFGPRSKVLTAAKPSII